MWFSPKKQFREDSCNFVDVFFSDAVMLFFTEKQFREDSCNFVDAFLVMQ